MKSNDEQSDLCELEQVTSKTKVHADNCLAFWLQIPLFALEKFCPASFRKAELLIRLIPGGIGTELSCVDLPF